MIIYLELIYSIICDFRTPFIGIIFAILMTLLISLIDKKWIRNTIYVVVFLIFLVYYIYYNLFGLHLSVSVLLNSLGTLKFGGMILNKINVLHLTLIFVSLAFLFIPFSFSLSKRNKWIIIVVLLLLYSGLVLIDNRDIYSKYNLFFKVQNNEENVKKFGLLSSIGLDISKTVLKFKDDSNVDFSKICDDDEICEISKYLESRTETEKNEYTGIFKGKNLIVFLAESFHPAGVDKELTPTLYKMINSGFKFENYYTPLFPVSTADSQYMLDYSLLPVTNGWSMTMTTDKSPIYSYPKVFVGYKSFAYHNYKYTYYQRDEYMANLGYQSYLGCGNGLESRMDCTLGQNSDLEMIETTVDDYIYEDKFLVYYTTMSGHANYDRNSAMVKKNYDKVESLPYSENVKGYIATQIELDNALKYLIERLDEEGKLEDTVILLSGDHPPYALDLEELGERLDYSVDRTFEKFHSNLIIYNPLIKDVVIDKSCSTLDVLPTMLNLFGINYDKRLLFGNDIFNDEKELVIFSSGSFIYDGNKYNASNERVEEGSLSEEEVKEIKNRIYLMYRYSRMILNSNYYSYIT